MSAAETTHGPAGARWRSALVAITLTALIDGLVPWAGEPFDALGGSTTLIWGPAGVALVALIHAGPWSLVGAVIGLGAYFKLSVYQLDWIYGAAFGAIDAGGALIAWTILRRLGFTGFGDRPIWSLLRFYAIAGVLVPIAKTAASAVVVWHSPLAPANQQFGVWAVANAIGESFGAILIVPPILMMLRFISGRRDEVPPGNARPAEIAVWAAMVCALLLLPPMLPSDHFVAQLLRQPFFLFPLLAWASLRFPLGQAFLATSFLALGAALAIKIGPNPLLAPDDLLGLIRLSLLLATLTVMAQVIAAATVARVQSETTGRRLDRERAALMRYFSPNIVELILTRDIEFGPPAEAKVGVLFCDIVGYSTLTENLPPTRILDLLRQFHAVTERVIFAHGGTLEKFIGDAVLATFGSPYPGPRDATNTLTCARALLAEIAELSRRRVAAGDPPIAIGIGIHYGMVVMGDIGSGRNMAFIVTGDTVNATSRLEEMTRTLDTPLIASAALIDRVRQEGATEGAAAAADLETAGEQPIRGRRQSISVWRLPPPQDA